ncbi:MAG: hypothetical protein V4576_03540 [Patescibacteria group bacterium]
MTQTKFDPQALAKQTLTEIETSFKKQDEETNILSALQDHYSTLERNQRLYIEYLTEFIDKLKHAQHTDTESLAQLKKQVLKHILQNEKARSKDDMN